MRRSRLRVSFHIPRHTWRYAGDPPSAANVKRKRGNTPQATISQSVHWASRMGPSLFCRVTEFVAEKCCEAL
jgi:hypothetical protein